MLKARIPLSLLVTTAYLNGKEGGYTGSQHEREVALLPWLNRTSGLVLGNVCSDV